MADRQGNRCSALKWLKAAVTIGMVTMLTSTALAAQYKIGIVQLVEHPALDDTRLGFIEAIQKSGLMGSKIEIEYKNAQGDISTVKTIVDKFVREKVDLIYAIATPPVQAAAASTNDIPIVFGAVRDPIGLKIVNSFERPGANITGTTHWTLVSTQIRVVLQAQPNAKRLGIVYNAGEANSLSQVKDARTWAKSEDVKLVERTVSNSSEIRQATESLVGAVDAIYIPTDNTVVSGLESLIAVAEKYHIPIYAADVDTVKRGAIAAYGADFIQLGKQAGNMAIRILTKGAKPATTPVEMQDEMDLAINVAAAKRMGITLPAAFISKAKIKY